MRTVEVGENFEGPDSQGGVVGIARDANQAVFVFVGDIVVLQFGAGLRPEVVGLQELRDLVGRFGGHELPRDDAECRDGGQDQAASDDDSQRDGLHELHGNDPLFERILRPCRSHGHRGEQSIRAKFADDRDQESSVIRRGR